MDVKYHRLAEELRNIEFSTSRDVETPEERVFGKVVNTFCTFLQEQDRDFNPDTFTKEVHG